MARLGGGGQRRRAWHRAVKTCVSSYRGTIKAPAQSGAERGRVCGHVSAAPIQSFRSIIIPGNW